MPTIREFLVVERLNSSNQPESGGIPQVQTSISTTSNLKRQFTQIVSNSAHEVVEPGDLTDDCLCYLLVRTANAVVSYGVDVGGTFYPVAEASVATGPVKLGLLSSLAGTYLKSSIASTEVEITLVKIAS